jgi:RNA polymerase sigma-70 factor (ECF subfamily)
METMEASDQLDSRIAGRAGPTQFDLVHADEITKRVDGAMAGLSSKERAAFVMRHFHEQSIDEIAEALELKTDAAKHAVFRAVRKMRAALRPLVDGYES